MNRSKIEWCDYTWNPVTGCWGPQGTAEKANWCSYCYALRVAQRFSPFEKTGYVQLKNQGINNDPFQPLFWPDRLDQPAKVKKPSKVFVCSMADLFGDWVPSEWILDVLAVVRACPQHTFQFLTKNPKRLSLWNGTWPSNCWVGTTVTNQADADERVPWLNRADASIKFISHEPLLGPITNGLIFYPVHWAIIGAQTGPGAVKPKLEWVRTLWEQYRQAGVPIFLKNNLKPIMGTLVQEWPNH